MITRAGKANRTTIQGSAMRASKSASQPYCIADRRPDSHRKNERRRNAGDRTPSAANRTPDATSALIVAKTTTGPGSKRGDCRNARRFARTQAEQKERHETCCHDSFPCLWIVEQTDVEIRGPADELLPAQVCQRSIKDARISGLLGNRPFRDAVEIARAIDFERRVVFEVEPRLGIGSFQALRSGARISKCSDRGEITDENVSMRGREGSAEDITGHGHLAARAPAPSQHRPFRSRGGTRASRDRRRNFKTRAPRRSRPAQTSPAMSGGSRREGRAAVHKVEPLAERRRPQQEPALVDGPASDADRPAGEIRRPADRRDPSAPSLRRARLE